MRAVPTSERAYNGLKRDLAAGTAEIGGRLDVADLARRFGTSVTPIREALMRLVGERLVEPHPVTGFRSAAISETKLRSLYQLNLGLMLMATDLATDANLLCLGETMRVIDQSDGLEPRARCFFRSIAQLAANAELEIVVEGVSDRLAITRRIETQVLPDGWLEFSRLAAATRSAAALRRTLKAYHKRRAKAAAALAWASIGNALAAEDRTYRQIGPEYGRI